MCCQDKEKRTKCFMTLFSVCHQLFSMTLFCMAVPYLRLVLQASYTHVAIVLGCSFLIDSVFSQFFGNWVCCKRPNYYPFMRQVFISAIVMIGSLMAFFTIHIWMDVDNGDLKAIIIGLATLFCGLALYAFDSFRSRLFMLFETEHVSRSHEAFLGFFLGAAMWTGFLWSPIDFSTGAYWLFGLASIIVFSFTCLILFIFSCATLDTSDSLLHYSISYVDDKEPSCCETIQKFRCLMWFSLFLVFLFNMSITPMSYFMIDWQTSCGNVTCLRDFNLGFDDANHPLHIYLYLSIASAIGYLVLSIIAKFCYISHHYEMTITMLTMGIFDIALFAIGYTGSQPWWIILFLVSQGFYLSSSWFIERRLPGFVGYFGRKKKGSSPDDSNEHRSRLIDGFNFMGQVTGILLISFVVENFDYMTLFKILSVLVLLTGISVVVMYIIVRSLMSSNRSEARTFYAKPSMIFKKSAKSA
jgi:hypothetical protein